MNKKLKLIALTIAAIMVITPMLTLSSVKAASWQTVSNDPYLCNANAWSSLFETYPSEGSYSGSAPSNSYASTTLDMRSLSNSYWNNAEFIQGYKPIWGDNPNGEPFNPVLLNQQMQVIVQAGLINPVVCNNWAHAYIDLWCEFETGVGSLKYNNMEIQIFLGEWGSGQISNDGIVATLYLDELDIVPSTSNFQHHRC